MAVFVLHWFGCGLWTAVPDDERTKNSFVFLDFMFLRRHIEATTRAPDLKFSPSRNIAMSFALAALPHCRRTTTCTLLPLYMYALRTGR